MSDFLCQNGRLLIENDWQPLAPGETLQQRLGYIRYAGCRLVYKFMLFELRVHFRGEVFIVRRVQEQHNFRYVHKELLR